MNRYIHQGPGSQYIEKTDKVEMFNTFPLISGKTKFPDTLNENQWMQLVDFLNHFLNSDESNKLAIADYKRLKKELDAFAAEDKKSEKGWIRMRGFLADAANATTILNPLGAFIMTHGDKVQWIKEMFQVMLK